MPAVEAITFKRHAGQRWQRPPHYGFAQADAVALLTLTELAQAALHLPIAFAAHKSAFLPVAVLGLALGKNLFVAPDGRWLAGYVPAIYSGYPFVLAPAADGQVMLCINEASGLLSSTAGEPFFTDDNEPNPAVSDILASLNQQSAHRQGTQRVCDALQQHGLIEPWPIELQGGATPQTIKGLFRINESALNKLPGDALAALRDPGALVMAYCQLLSMQHLQMLGKLAVSHAQVAVQAEVQATANTSKAAAKKAQVAALLNDDKELDLSFLHGNDTLKFF